MYPPAPPTPKRAAPRLLALCAALCLASPRAWAEPSANPDPAPIANLNTDGPRPYVPRWQGPPQAQAPSEPTSTLGWALIGAGSVSGGVGLFLLQNPGPNDSPASAGTGLVLGGVFLGGAGLYLLASSGLFGGRIVLTGDPLHDPDAPWTFGLVPTQGGALAGAHTRF